MAEKPAQSKQAEAAGESLEQVKEQLAELGKKRGILTYEEIAERLSGFDLDSDQMDEYYEYLAEQGIEVISESTLRPIRTSTTWPKRKNST